MTPGRIFAGLAAQGQRQEYWSALTAKPSNGLQPLYAHSCALTWLAVGSVLRKALELAQTYAEAVEGRDEPRGLAATAAKNAGVVRPGKLVKTAKTTAGAFQAYRNSRDHPYRRPRQERESDPTYPPGNALHQRVS